MSKIKDINRSGHCPTRCGIFALDCLHRPSSPDKAIIGTIRVTTGYREARALLHELLTMYHMVTVYGLPIKDEHYMDALRGEYSDAELLDRAEALAVGTAEHSYPTDDVLLHPIRETSYERRKRWRAIAPNNTRDKE